MSIRKRHLVPVDELLQRLEQSESIESIAQDLSERNAVRISSSLVRLVARDNGWVFPPRGNTTRTRHLVPVNEVLTMLGQSMSVEDVTRILRERSGAEITTTVVRAVARENGWTFSGPRDAPRIEIPNLPELARRHDNGETFKALAAEADVNPTPLSKRLKEEGLHPSQRPGKEAPR